MNFINRRILINVIYCFSSLALSLVFLQCDSSDNAKSKDLKSNSSTTENIPSISEKVPIDSLKLFLSGFNNSTKFPISVNKDSYDSSRQIEDSFITKYLGGNHTKYFYGNSFSLENGITAVIYHFTYDFEPESVWISGLHYIGSNIILMNQSGDRFGTLSNIFHAQEGWNEIGEYYIRNKYSTINRKGEISFSNWEKTGEFEDSISINYENIGRTTLFAVDDNNHFKEVENRIIEYQSYEINPNSRSNILELLEEIKNIVFVSVVIIDGKYYRIKEHCREDAKFHFLSNKAESTFSWIDEWYYPIFVNELNEYSAVFIESVEKNQSGNFSLSTIDMNGFDKEKGIIDLDVSPRLISFSKNTDGFWMMTPTEVSNILYIDEQFSSTLEFTDSPCDIE